MGPEESIVIYYKGRFLTELEQYEEAIKCYDKAIELEPDFAEAHVNKGICT